MPGQGQFYSISETVTPRRTISDVIDIIDPRDIVCLSMFGTNNQGKFNLDAFPNHKYAWLEDSLRPRVFTLAGGLTTGATTVAVAAGHGARIAVDDVWKSVETGELVLITTHTGTDTIGAMTRNYTAAQGGTEGTATSTVTTGTNFTFLYTVRLEGADSTPSRWNTPVEVYNYSQIMHHQLHESGSSQDATTRYGISNWREYEIAKVLGGAGASKNSKGRAGDLLIDLENTFFGKQVKTQRTAAVRGVMAGARTLITTNVFNKAGASFTQEMFEDAIAAADGYGGMPDTVICNQFQWRMINSWFKDNVVRQESESTGGIVIDRIKTVFGELDLTYNRRCPADEVYILQKDRLGWVTLRDWAIEPLGKDGDSDKEQIVGEFGFVLRSEKAHAIIHTLATS
jgi:Family of unknown function (DUF5309)